MGGEKGTRKKEAEDRQTQFGKEKSSGSEKREIDNRCFLGGRKAKHRPREVIQKERKRQWHRSGLKITSETAHQTLGNPKYGKPERQWEKGEKSSAEGLLKIHDANHTRGAGIRRRGVDPAPISGNGKK